MVIKGLVRSFSCFDVTGYVFKDVRVSLQAMLESGARPFERVELGVDSLAMPLRSRVDAIDLKPLSLDVMPEADRGLPGLLVSATRTAALELLVDTWIPGAGGPIDDAIAQARASRAAGRPFLSVMESLVVGESLGRRPHLDSEDVSGVVWAEEAFEEKFNRVARSRPEVMLPEHRGWGGRGNVGVVVERTCDIAGQPVRRYDAMVFFGRGESRRVMVSSGGRWECTSPRKMDPDVLKAFETRGRAVHFDQGDLTSWNAWKVIMAVRVPASGDASGVDERPSCLDGIPVARLADLRMPIPLSSRVRVVEDPAEALAILCRVSRGFVISGLGGDVLPAPIARHRGKLLAVCVPSQWDVAA
ncbi:MAG TPA: hypothetical protein PLY68_10790 [Myxococcota bacterium]|nr:hypothetical protein [Candidatus Fermentibacter daniensis]HOD08770.1 hypothetical protein [Myxococcota bacterium]HPB51764.1 hypothetical protein [Myxococcota bacterium]HQP96665.1 hypothetical protein [Myxococcota bacterium]